MEQVHGYDYKADLWSLGITALELAKGYAPYAKYPPMKVLILTIQEEPPSLATYDYEETDDDDEEDYAQEWSTTFSNIISWLLQKNPADRPTCQELLTSLSTAHTLISQSVLKTQICDIVKDVGSKSQQQQQQQSSSAEAPGTAPVWIQSAEDRPAGTTWVFADGSQVLASDAKEADVDDVLSEFDQFCGATGGENYNRESTATTQQAAAAAVRPAAATTPDDGLDDFLDEFEKTTAGENFQRNN